MKIKWIGQSGYIIKTETTEIMIDPYLSDVVNRVANRPRMVDAPIKLEEIKADAVLCTHNHLDHLDVDAIAKMRKEQFFITTNEGKIKLQEMGRENSIALALTETVMVGDIEVTAVFANHTVEAFGGGVYQKAFGELRLYNRRPSARQYSFGRARRVSVA